MADHIPVVALVEDEPDQLLLLRVVIGGAGYRILEIDSSARALQQIRDNAPDVVVTDVLMPGVDGVELLRAMRADPKLARIPVLMVSAHSEPRQIMRAIADLGPVEFLARPFGARQLIDAMKKLLGGAPSN